MYSLEVKELIVDSLEELFDFFRPEKEFSVKKYLFRGQSNKNHLLIPSIAREGFKPIKEIFRKHEIHIIDDGTPETFDEKDVIAAQYFYSEDFYSRANKLGINLPIFNFAGYPLKIIISELFDNEDYNSNFLFNLLQISSIAQHYGLPSILLDWSYSPLVGLFFAAEGLAKKENYEEDDAIVLWALEDDLSGEDLIQITPDYFHNPNIRAQKGTFMEWIVSPIKKSVNEPFKPLVTNLLDYSWKRKRIIYKIVCKPLLSKGIISYLANYGITEATLYPSLRNVAKAIKKDM